MQKISYILYRQIFPNNVAFSIYQNWSKIYFTWIRKLFSRPYFRHIECLFPYSIWFNLNLRSINGLEKRPLPPCDYHQYISTRCCGLTKLSSKISQIDQTDFLLPGSLPAPINTTGSFDRAILICALFAWLSLNFILQTSWVALYYVVCVRDRCHPTKSLFISIYTGIRALCWPCNT